MAGTGRPTGTISAVAEVIGTTELLEQILIGVDMKTLLLAQRVSSGFRDLIAKSPSLQKKLFMRPATMEEAISLYTPESARTNSHLLVTNRCYVGDLPKIGQEKAARDSACILFNPLLALSKYDHTDESRSAEFVYLFENLRNSSKYAAADLVLGLTTDLVPGSWRKMYVCMPSVAKKECAVYGYISIGSGGYWGFQPHVGGIPLDKVEWCDTVSTWMEEEFRDYSSDKRDWATVKLIAYGRNLTVDQYWKEARKAAEKAKTEAAGVA